MSRVAIALVAAVVLAAAQLVAAGTAGAEVFGPNLVANPSAESGSRNPSSWSQTNSGSNQRKFAWLSGGAQDGTRSLRVELSRYSSGEAAWSPSRMAVAPGATYEFGHFYRSSGVTAVVVVYRNASGSTIGTTTLGSPAVSPTNWTAFTTRLTTPANAATAVVYHAIRSTGWVQTDNYRLRTVGPDPVAPTVAVTAPTAGSTVSGNVALSATASVPAPATIAGVQFHVDGVPVGAEDTTSPYGVSWPSAGVGNGTHTVTATARTTAGVSATSPSVSFNVQNTAATPTVSITSPAPGATVSGSVTLAATASVAAPATIAGVQFLLDGNPVGAEDTTSPYALSWSSTQVPNGSHTISARARTTAGGTATSSTVTVTVDQTVVRPGSELTRPIRIMPLGDSITIGMHGTGADWNVNKSLRGGYRAKLQELLTGAGVSIDSLGQSDAIDLRESVTDKDHEGHGGWCIVGGGGTCWGDGTPQSNGDGGLDAHIGTWLPQFAPDVILLHIATNDFASGRGVDTNIANYSALIDQIYRLRPNAYLVISAINIWADSPVTPDFNAKLQQLVAQKSPTYGNKIFFVDTYVGMTAPIWGDDANELHPSLANYEVMGQNWFNALRTNLPGIFPA